MAKPANDKTKASENVSTEETTGEGTEPAATENTGPDYPTGETLAQIIALKQKHGVLGARPWKMKGGTTEIPQRFDKAEVTQYEPKVGATDAETMENLKAFCAGTDEEKRQAIVDTFAAAHRLAAQKRGKDEMGETSTDVATVQDIANGFLSGSKRRGTGKASGAAKVRAEKAEAKAAQTTQTAQEIIAEMRAMGLNDQADKWEERLKTLGQL